jgi:hypothetical protein
MVGVYYPKSGQQWLAGKVRTALAASKIRLYQSSINPTENTTLAELEAAEADYDGYAEITITNFGAVFQSPLGAAIQMPSVQFQGTDPMVVTNNIGGAWIEDSTGALVNIIGFPEAKAMSSPLDALPLSEILRFGSGL